MANATIHLEYEDPVTGTNGRKKVRLKTGYVRLTLTKPPSHAEVTAIARRYPHLYEGIRWKHQGDTLHLETLLMEPTKVAFKRAAWNLREGMVPIAQQLAAQGHRVTFNRSGHPPTLLRDIRVHIQAIEKAGRPTEEKAERTVVRRTTRRTMKPQPASAPKHTWWGWASSLFSLFNFEK